MIMRGTISNVITAEDSRCHYGIRISPTEEKLVETTINYKIV